jgi:hypothetical protein
VSHAQSRDALLSSLRCAPANAQLRLGGLLMRLDS